MKKTIAVLGVTGSVGSQAMDVAASRGYTVDFISANENVSLAEKYARQHRVRAVAMASENAAKALKAALSDTNIKVLSGNEGIIEGIKESRAETFINSIIGEAGLLPTLAVVDSGRRLGLANKESLVIAGKEVMCRAKASGAELIPVDSEHSAIFQSLKSGKSCEVKRLILTASGGPFFGKSRKELEGVSLADVLAHPTWKMGRKITVDSATLMNKGFEVIEAAHLFSVAPEQIEVVVHRESILHSAVEYIDNTVIGELSVPDMRMCIQYAVDYPDRCSTSSAALDLIALGKMSFYAPDTEAFPLLSLAKRAMSLGGAMPAVLNAADEIAVAAHLSGELSFNGISDVVSETFCRMSHATGDYTVEELIAYDREARAIAKNIIKEK